MRTSGAAPRYRRARAVEQKAERREAILDAAERMLLQSGAYAAIRMDRIAHRLGLAKGTLYLYFDTKEALFLAVMHRAFAFFFDQAEARIEVGRSTRPAVATAILAALDATPALPCLASVLHTALEHNVGDAEVAAFKHFLRERVTRLGTRIDRALGWPGGSGAVLLLRFHVLLIGLHHVSTPSRVVTRVLADDALALFRIDFRRQLIEMLPLLMSTPRGGVT
jgi:AcrR family transcriptional regulator